ncbi:MAG: phage tail protein [Candidatus Aminicenantes bacterium]|nr:phage tail protein [Candidatus Aminicenantes bacterium]NIM84441.1 phage tail protein [Candidatus Aminicenantes bacterium]NIN23961.1 phage tail protein [Candidatus Aminicenantes bacterium]NIN47675.1 phage tail protein [Candidatus Aminicenantes bacterium]NIN90605.1 phage tail protein [Candidatus Aminicenantes bacterium]
MSESLLDYLGSTEEEEAYANRIYGVVPAKVTNTKDPEKLGRIKVNYPWLAEASESDWIRIASFMAGSGRGGFFLPDVGDEVLVSFQQGDFDSPFIIGALWSTDAKPPEENADGKNNIKLIKSRCGHTITISDDTEASKAKIEIKTNAGHIILMDDASGSEKIEIKDKTGNNKITIDSTANAINIESSMEIKLKATNITIEASGQLNLKGATAKVEASATLDLNASGIATLKGSMTKIN